MCIFFRTLRASLLVLHLLGYFFLSTTLQVGFKRSRTLNISTESQESRGRLIYGRCKSCQRVGSGSGGRADGSHLLEELLTFLHTGGKRCWGEAFSFSSGTRQEFKVGWLSFDSGPFHITCSLSPPDPPPTLPGSPRS